MEVSNPKELAELGLNSLNELACDYIPPCLQEFGFLNIIANEFGLPADLLGGGAGMPTSGNPVAIGNGAKWQIENHYQGSGPFPLKFTRTYLSRSYQTLSWLGAKWSGSYFQQISVQPTVNGQPFPLDRAPKNVLMARSDGSWAQFNFSGTNIYAPSGNIRGVVERMLSSNNLIAGCRYHTPWDTVELFSASGQLLQIQDKSGLTHSLGFDGFGRPATVTDSYGRRLSFTYNEEGYLETLTDPLARVTRFRYDESGNFIESLEPDSQTRQYHYENLSQRFLLTGITDERGVRVSRWTYDTFGGVKTANHGDELETRSYEYARNQVTETDPLGTSRTYRYSMFRDMPYLTGVTEPCSACGSGSTAEQGYDARGFVTSTRDFRGNRATYQRDARGLITAMTEALGTPEARTTAITWHPQFYLPARVVEPITGGCRTTVLTHDSEGNRFTRAVTANSQTVKKSQTVGTGTPKVLATSYQANGQIEGHVLPSGAVIRYTYRADGRVLTIAVNGVVVVREIEYHPMGPVKSWRYGTSNDRYEREFDRDGRIKEHTAASATRTIGFDPASRITSITDGAAGPSWTYDYDKLDRLKTADSSALKLDWNFDATGNRLSEKRAVGVAAQITTAYAIDSVSNKLSSVGTTNRTYDSVGNTTLVGADSSVYSARNRLVQVNKNGTLANYGYDAFGERVKKQVGANTSQFVYDDDGHVLGEYDAAGALTSEYVWLGDVPVAVIKPNASTQGGIIAGTSKIYLVQPDHLNTPRVIVNAANQIVWRWDSAPFGDTNANEQPTASLASFSFNLRFPGQQIDVETGSHYNYFRDYEAGLGRYLQSDPIGLEGGLNTYTYVVSSPLINFDKTGEVHGNSNNAPGPCVFYFLVSILGWDKVGESCNGNDRPALKRRCDEQKAKQKKITGIRHFCLVSPAIPCTKGTIKKVESAILTAARACGCTLPGNKEHLKGKKK